MKKIYTYARLSVFIHFASVRGLLAIAVLFWCCDLHAQNFSSLPYTEDFEDGNVGTEWELNNTGGRAEVDTGGPNAYSGDYYLVLDEGSSNAGQASADLYLNTTGVCKPQLNFKWYQFGDDGGDPGDGIFISTDGGTSFTKVVDWAQELDDNALPEQQWVDFTYDIDSLMQANGLAYPNDHEIVIRIAQEEGDGRYSGGFGIDDVHIQEGMEEVIDEEYAFTSAFPEEWSRSRADAVEMNGSCNGADGYAMQFNSSENNDWFTTQTIDASTFSSVEFSYLIRNGNENDGCGEGARGSDEFEVQYWDGSQWTTLKTESGASAPTTFVRESFTITQGLTENFQIRFYATSGAGVGFDWAWFIDDFRIEGQAEDIGVSQVDLASNEEPLGLEGIEVQIENFKNVISAGTSIPISYTTTLMDSVKTVHYTLESDLVCDRTIEVGPESFGCNGVHDIKVWSDFDGNPSNDTASTQVVNLVDPMVKEGFENGSSQFFTLNDNQGRAEITNSLGNPHSGDYHAILHNSRNGPDNANPHIDFTLDFSEHSNYQLAYWWFYNYDDDEPEDGIFASTDGGASFHKIYDYDMDNYDNQWYHFSFNLKALLEAENLDAKGEVIFRFSQKSNSDWTILPGDGQAYDDITIYPREKAEDERASTTGFNVPDSVYINSPTDFFNRYPENETGSHRWYVNGEEVSNSKNLTHAFSQKGENEVQLVSGGCFGRETVTKDIDVILPYDPPVANFGASKYVLDTLEQVTLYDESSNGPTQWEWSIEPDSFDAPGQQPGSAYDFLDGSDLNSSDVSLQFLSPGTYDVCLEASNRIVRPDGKLPSQKLCREDFLIVRENVSMCDGTSATNHFYGKLYDDGGEEGDYSNNAECAYLIQPCADSIVLNLEQFDLEAGDYLRFYDGQNDDGLPLWNVSRFGEQGLTGDVADSIMNKTYIANSGNVYVEFQSDGSNTAEGFQLNWRSERGSFNAPDVNINVPDTVCLGGEFGISANATNDQGISYDWYYDGTLIGEGQSFPYAFSDSGGKREIQVVASACGGYDTTAATVFVDSHSQNPQVGFYAQNRNPIPGENIVQFHDTTLGCVDSLEWEFSTSALEYVNGTDSNSANPEVRFNETGCIDVTLDVFNNQGTSTISKSCYIEGQCIPSVYNLSSDIGIGQVDIGSISHASSIGTSNYTNYFDELSTDVEIGEKTNLEIQRNTALNQMNLKVWVDIDGDSDFDETSELVAYKEAGHFIEWDTSFILPDTTQTGALRMRIGASLNDQANTYCGPNNYGEFEDYKLNVTPDQTSPEIFLQGNDTISLAPCASLRNIDTGTYAMDNVDGRIDTFERSGTIDSSTAGIDSLEYRFEDAAGNVATAKRYMLFQKDEIKPQFSLVGNDTIDVQVNTAFVDPGFTSVSDNCSGIDTVFQKSELDTSDLGLYQVNYYAFDEAGNEAKLTRYVRVVDTIDPVLKLRGPKTVHIPLDSTFNDPGVDTLYDNYWSQASLNLKTEGTVNTAVLDTFELLYELTDGAGNQVTKSRQVVITDEAPPEISTQVADTVTLDVGDELSLQEDIQVDDNSNREVHLTRKGAYFKTLNAEGEADVLGHFEAHFVYADLSGNKDSVSLIVDVVDQVSPAVELVGNKTVNIARWQGTEYLDSVEFTDNHGIMEMDTTGTYFTEYIQEDYPLGVFEIEYSATDSAGNESSVTRIVNVEPSTSIDQDAETAEFEVYPNPTDGALNIRFEGNGQRGSLKVINAIGKPVEVVADGNIDRDDYRINLNEEAAGVYFVKFQSGEDVQVKRFVLTK